jgi:hypothetical protein
MLPSITKAAHPIAAAVTVIVIAGQWCRRKARIGMQTYGFQIELANRFSMRATACAVTSIAPVRREAVAARNRCAFQAARTCKMGRGRPCSHTAEERYELAALIRSPRRQAPNLRQK